MVRSASMVATPLIGALCVCFAAFPSFAGDYRSQYEQEHDNDVDCYAVTKAYEYRGRPALFGGTQCRDRYGNAWIAAGSRYFIRYLGGYDEYGYHDLDRLPHDGDYDH
ncbi:MAG: hypothetical protein AAFO01_09130 [Pseudomonadota bacterium]